MTREILYGIHPVTEAIKAGKRKIIEVCIGQEKHGGRSEAVAAMAKQQGIPIRRMSKADLTALTASDAHQGVGAVVSAYPTAGLNDIYLSAEQDAEPHFLLILDHIVDPHNLGALIRTAFCAGVHGVVFPKDRAAYPSPAVSKISSGALEHILAVQVTNLSAAVKELKKKGIWIAGLDPSAKKSVFNSDLTGHLALVIGGEEKGISPLIKSNCDFLISIPQKRTLNSLNASAAGAIVMYEAYRQRHFILQSA